MYCIDAIIYYVFLSLEDRFVALLCLYMMGPGEILKISLKGYVCTYRCIIMFNVLSH